MACDRPISVKWKDEGVYIPLPCGKCAPCIKRRIDSWVFRCEQEDRISRSSHFLTLTYSPESLPKNTVAVPGRGNIDFPTLRKRDFQLFMKRLRKAVVADFPNHPKLKYYACGEYGETYRRPHYHAIIFNCPSPAYYTSAWSCINDTTKERTQKGLIHIGQVTQNSIAYVAAYIQKNSGRTPWPGCEKEFALFSRGIGKSYLISGYTEADPPKPIYTDAYHWHRQYPDRLYITKPGGHRIAMPRYYRQIIWSESERSGQIDIIHEAVERQLDSNRSALTAKGKNWVHEEREARKARDRKYQQRKNLKNRNYE